MVKASTIYVYRQSGRVRAPRAIGRTNRLVTELPWIGSAYTQLQDWLDANPADEGFYTLVCFGEEGRLPQVYHHNVEYREVPVQETVRKLMVTDAV